MFTSNTAEHDAANQRLLQKSAELITLSAAFVATFVGSGIFRLRLRQSLRQRSKPALSQQALPKDLAARPTGAHVRRVFCCHRICTLDPSAGSCFNRFLWQMWSNSLRLFC